MKRLSGGAVLLNLTDISLGITSGEVTISDAGVLGELTELRNFIDTQRDFSKGFKSLKPVLVEYRSSASKFNGIALANLSFNTDALHMSIGVNTIQADGKMLVITINVVYAWSDYIGYTISSAKLNACETLATGEGTFTGDVGVGGDLAVTGDASFGGDTSGIKIEDLVDKAGNKRFIENNLNVNDSLSGFTFTYAKWSLSGTHLMVVVAFKIDADTSISGSFSIANENTMPEWLRNKIFPSGDNEKQVAVKYADEWVDTNVAQEQHLYCGLQLLNNGHYQISTWGNNFTPSVDTYFRIAFDLLIDDDYE